MSNEHQKNCFDIFYQNIRGLTIKQLEFWQFFSPLTVMFNGDMAEGSASVSQSVS